MNQVNQEGDAFPREKQSTGEGSEMGIEMHKFFLYIKK